MVRSFLHNENILIRQLYFHNRAAVVFLGCVVDRSFVPGTAIQYLFCLNFSRKVHSPIGNMDCALNIDES